MASYDPLANTYSRKIALAIGNNNYRKNVTLESCVNDANCVSEALTDIGFIVTTRHNLTNDAITKEILAFKNKILEGDLVLFYYSGHGYQVNGENYLVPIDDEEFKKEEDVQSTCYGVENLNQQFCRKNAKSVTILIIDCCRSCFPADVRKDKGTTSGSLAAMNPPAGIFIMFACGSSMKAKDGSSKDDNSLFTRYLLKWLKTSNEDIVQIAQGIALDVFNESLGIQRPVYMSGILGVGRIYLNERRDNMKKIPNISSIARWSKRGVTIAGTPSGVTSTELSAPYGLFIDNHQNIVVADWGKHSIIQFEKGSTKGKVVAGGNGEGSENNQLRKPIDVIVDNRRNTLIISDFGNRRIVEWWRSSAFNGGKVLIENIDCWGIAMDDEKNLYVSDYKKHEVRRYARDGSGGTRVAGSGEKGSDLPQLNQPQHLFVDQNQNLYISDTGNHRVMKWCKDATSGVIVAGNQNPQNGFKDLNFPRGLFVDALGTLYVADWENHNVTRWLQGATRGTIIAGGNDPGSEDDQLNKPVGLFLDADGNLYVLDFKNCRVQRFSKINS